ncbi:MAG TPA: gephyrin-like molybdotransferase Glp [Candidatus Bathyarchaeia archaeon]|nr:gephyrin-like molybdotransferase Glp [Candidatus Bathyarchaeia archaeon]
MVKLKGFQKLTSTEDALSKWLGVLKIRKPSAVNVALSEALNRVLEEDAIADESLPRFDRSAMDGYALNSENTAGASQFKPTLLQLTQTNIVGSKQAKQVWTGNPIPKGADAVVMIEKTQKRDDGIEVWTQLAPNENVSRVGEDLKKGEVAIKAGTRLNPYHLALLAALGKTQVKVTKKPTIAILATGNELAELGCKPEENQVFDSNRTMLSAMCRELGAEPLELGIARDDVEEIAEKINSGLKQADAAITTGGTSVGGLDLVPDAVNKLGNPGVIVHGVAMRPGMPTALAVVNGKPVMVLSGNPVAAIVGFEVFARPLISKMMGIKKEDLQPTVKAVMTRRVSSALGRKTFVRVKAFMKNGEVFAEPVSAKGSGAISTMTRGNGFVVVPENREGVTEGEAVTVRLFAGLETDNEDV